MVTYDLYNVEDIGMMNQLALYELSDSLVDSCVDLFIETFSGYQEFRVIRNPLKKSI